jgi:hypothetical protein
MKQKVEVEGYFFDLIQGAVSENNHVFAPVQSHRGSGPGGGAFIGGGMQCLV